MRDAELDIVMQRFFALSAADQLRAYEGLRDYLGADVPMETKADRQINRRADSLAAVAQVADHLGLEGRAPTVKQFDSVARELGLSWTARTVGEAWGRWRFACDAHLGEPPRLTASQRSLRRRLSGVKRSHDDYLTAVRLWLATDPPLERPDDYDAWAREHNNGFLQDGELPVPGATAIRYALALAWRDAVRVGRGEASLDEVSKLSTAPRDDWTKGPHDLISLISAARVLGISMGSCLHRSFRPEFPTPVAHFSVKRQVRAWLRGDIEIYRDTGVAPKRQLNGLRGRYYGTEELAALTGVAPVSLSTARGYNAPRATGRVGGCVYWLKKDADRWIRQNKELIERRLARKAALQGGKAQPSR